MSLLTNVLKLWRTGQYLLPADSGFMVKHLFANGEPGFAKLDFSGFAGMYQDRARTIPYTAVEQPLGSFTGLNGVTATAPADVNRGVVSARVNLLRTTETLAVWGLTGIGGASIPVITPGQVDHVGGNTGVRVVLSLNGETTISAHSRAGLIIAVTPGTAYTIRFWIKSNTGSNSTLRFRDDVSGTVDTHLTVTPSWQFVTHTGTAVLATGSANTSPLWLRGGDGTSDFADVTIAHISTTLATDAHLPYQRVNTPTDYDTAGFPHYLAFNGTNTAYVTPSIDFTGTDKMTVWAGFTEFNTSAGILSELGVNAGSISRTFYLAVKDSGMTSFIARGDGTASIGRRATTGNLILAGTADLSIPSVVTRINSTTVGNTVLVGNTAPAFSNNPLYIGARAGTSLFFNGRIYSLIVRGAQSSLSQIEATENLIRKTMRLP